MLQIQCECWFSFSRVDYEFQRLNY